MRTILILNSKGGCGKSLLATNLSAFFALQGKQVALADFDPQASSLEWLKARPADHPVIHGVDAIHDAVRPPRQTEIMIVDAPAGIHGKDLTAIVRRTETILIPALPSATDIRATAHFVQDLLMVGKVERKQTRLATVANRVPAIGASDGMLSKIGYDTLNMRIFQPLERFLQQLRIPFVASIPESPYYALADQKGLSIFEWSEGYAAQDRAAWRPLLDWLDSRQSRPR